MQTVLPSKTMAVYPDICPKASSTAVAAMLKERPVSK